MAEERDMVALVSESSGGQLQARQEATRSGINLVPDVIREAGPKAVESFLCFFARTKSEHTAYVYGSAASHFFRWCSDRGLQLDVLRAGHVAGFFEAKRDEWKISTAKIYFWALRLLFKHLEADRIIEQSPFAVAELPKRPETESNEQKLVKLRQFLRELDGYVEDSEFFRPGQVAVFPLFFGSMDETKIAATTGIPREEVETYIGRLRTNGIWTEDGKIAIDSEEQTEAEFVVTDSSRKKDTFFSERAYNKA